jgi:hypothetical protein
LDISCAETSTRKPESRLTIQQAAKTALECQDACNLSGALTSFKEIDHEVIWPEGFGLPAYRSFHGEKCRKEK